MKKSKKWVLLVAMVIPGYFTCSCSGTWAREFRDAVIAGTADAVQTAAFDLMTGFIPAPDDAD